MISTSRNAGTACGVFRRFKRNKFEKAKKKKIIIIKENSTLLKLNMEFIEDF